MYRHLLVEVHQQLPFGSGWTELHHQLMGGDFQLNLRRPNGTYMNLLNPIGNSSSSNIPVNVTCVIQHQGYTLPLLARLQVLSS
ncbi:MAG: hypothetical protein IPM86_02940 [Saprospiraceae bacterium]|nr:hypothetical protein [Saprospiraceae bacterium]